MNKNIYRKTGRLLGAVFFLWAAMAAPVGAQGTSALTPAQVHRVKACQQLLAGVDKKSLEQHLQDLGSRYTEENLQILEAVANAYAEIVEEQQVIGQEKKEWLYSVVMLNMAYLQMGGMHVNRSGDTALNRLIQAKLKRRLSSSLTADENLFYTLDYLE